MPEDIYCLKATSSGSHLIDISTKKNCATADTFFAIVWLLAARLRGSGFSITRKKEITCL
ncbi:hypothetical protein, partial [Citrobacter braakii]|uniref:hypothetical protein n=1 Tax=Citrobacter braakii TaxID=57706 RepID=UPI001C6FCCEC